MFGKTSLALVCFFVVNQISPEALNGFAPNSQGRCVWSLAQTSLNVKVKDQRSRSPGTKMRCAIPSPPAVKHWSLQITSHSSRWTIPSLPGGDVGGLRVVKHLQLKLLLFSGGGSAHRDDTANLRQPTDDGRSADDGGTARYGAVRHGVANANPTAADPTEPAGIDAAGTRCRGKRRHLESTELHHRCGAVAVGHIHWTVGDADRSAARCRATGRTAAAENHLDWSVLLRLRSPSPSAILVHSSPPC